MRQFQQIARILFAIGMLAEGHTALLAKPVAVTLLTEESAVEFVGRDTNDVLKFNGTGKGVVGKFKFNDGKAIEGEANFPLNTLDTGIEKRNTHMREHLEVSKMPEAKFVPTSLPWTDPSQVLTQATKDTPFEGKLTLHGVEKPVKGTVTSTPGKAGRVDFAFAFKVLLTDFSITVPSFLGVKVDNTIDVVVKAPAKVDAL